MWLLKLLLGLAAFSYLAILAALYFGQTKLVFPAHAAAGGGPLPPGAERIDLATPDNNRLSGIHIRPRAPDPHHPLILGFGGNAWNADDVALTLASLYPAHEIVVFHYRGYRPSSGEPSAAALLADAPAIHDEITRRYRPSSIVAVGFSVGTGVAAHLAKERPLKGIILVTPFDSLASVAAGHYKWLPVRFLFRHEMPSAENLRQTRTPVAIVAASNDTLILPARTEALRQAIPNLAYDRTISGTGHNDIYAHPDFVPSMREALEQVTAATPPTPSPRP